jgi:hypothetical protein
VLLLPNFTPPLLRAAFFLPLVNCLTPADLSVPSPSEEQKKPGVKLKEGDMSRGEPRVAQLPHTGAS